MKRRETYQIYTSLESAYEHIQKKIAPPWNYRVERMEIGKSFILGSDEYWIKVTYSFEDEEDC